VLRGFINFPHHVEGMYVLENNTVIVINVVTNVTLWLCHWQDAV